MAVTQASIRNLIELQLSVKGSRDIAKDDIIKDQAEIDRLRQTISLEVKQNMLLDGTLKDLDETIKLFVRQKMSIRDLIASSQRISARSVDEGVGFLGKAKKGYEELFDLLQKEPQYLARLARKASAVELPVLVQVIIFSIYGDQYEARLERFLLLMLEMMLDQEYKLCSHMGEFMRANTATTQLLSAYCKRGKGMSLLKEILQPILSRMASDADLDLEINPAKVYEGIIKQQELETGKESHLPKKPSPDDLEKNPEVQRIVGERVKKLEAILEELFSVIVANSANFPFGIRWISRRMKELCLIKWPKATPEEVDSIVGGLCFLRFITPGITTPDSLHIIDQAITYRRNFILVAKVVQNLSNHVPFGSKEEFMLPMNKFLERQNDKLQRFFDELCSVESLDEHMRMEILCILGRREQVISISVNDIYHVHALLDKYQQELVDAPNDPLVKALANLGVPPGKVDREQDSAVNLILPQPGHISSHTIDIDATEDSAFGALKETLMTFLREQPPIPADDRGGVAGLLRQLRENANAKADYETVNQIRTMTTLMGQLVSDKKYDSVEAVTMAACVDIARQLEMRQNLRLNLMSAKKILQEIRKQRADMEATLAMHQQYLQNVEMHGRVDGRDKAPKLPDKEFTHKELEERRIIIESRLPLEVRKRLKFVISTRDCLSFVVKAKFKSIEAFTVELQIKNLLAMQDAGEQELEVAGEVTLNVNLLMHLLNQNFLLKNERMIMKGK